MLAEKTIIKMTVEIGSEKIEALKNQLRAAGLGTHFSATDALLKAAEQYGNWAKSVRLDEPERREIESRCGTQVPIRCSKDVLRAFESLAGGPSFVAVPLDPSIGDLMRDVARGMGLGLAEFAAQVIEGAYFDHYLESCELRPLFFKPDEWKTLQKMAGSGRMRTAGELLTFLREALPAKETPCQSTPIPTVA